MKRMTLGIGELKNSSKLRDVIYGRPINKLKMEKEGNKTLDAIVVLRK